jgi:hypothetical protein
MAAVARSRYLLDRDEQGALDLSREALALESGDERTEAICLNTIGLARVRAGDAGGIADLERSVELAQQSGSFFHFATGLNNLANVLWEVGRLADGSARIHEARALCERYGLAALLEWNDAELIYDAYFRGNLQEAVAGATSLLDRGLGGAGYQEKALRATRSLGLLALGQTERAADDAELALAKLRGAGADAQTESYILTAAALSRRAAGRVEEADAVLADAMAAAPDETTYELPLHLVELGRSDEYLAQTDGRAGQVWLDAGRAAAAGELARASEIYGSFGARFPEAWAGLLAAERGDTSRLEAALAYFEEQQATPYVQRCRALLQASA